MRRLLPTICAAGIAVGAAATLAGTAMPAAAHGHVRHCRRVRQGGLAVVHIRARHMRCRSARGVAGRWLRATSHTITRHGSRTGHCFGAHSYGKCVIRYRRRRFGCYHYNAAQDRYQRTRCHRGRRVVVFR